MLEAGPEPVGSWPRDPHRCPRRTGQRVTSVEHDGEFTVRAADEYTAPVVIAATGGFGRPHRPDLGLAGYTGRLMHASEYREPGPFAGQRIVIVDAGNTAVQIGAELAEHATVTLATRKPVSFATQRPLGLDLQFWFTVTGVGFLTIASRYRAPPRVPVLDTGVYRRAVRAGKPDQRRMFTRVEEDTVIWPDGTRDRVDTIVLATGYRPDFGYLPAGAIGDGGFPRQHKGLSTTHPGLAFVGLEWQRGLLSASLRGVGRDARYVVRRLGGDLSHRR